MGSCARCGAPHDDEARFCSACGALLAEDPWTGATGDQWTEPAEAEALAHTHPMAVASLTLGVLWIWWMGSLLAVVFGAMALRQIDESEGTQTGRGLAVAGIILGCVGLASLLLASALAL